MSMGQAGEAVDNALSPHGGILVERVASPQEAGDLIRGLPAVAVRDQTARECVNIAYGFFSPLEGFMGRADLDSVARRMTLASGYVWSTPILFDLSSSDLARLGTKPGGKLQPSHLGPLQGREWPIWEIPG
jgi:sulfate adenylyltransferase